MRLSSRKTGEALNSCGICIYTYLSSLFSGRTQIPRGAGSNVAQSGRNRTSEWAVEGLPRPGPSCKEKVRSRSVTQRSVRPSGAMCLPESEPQSHLSPPPLDGFEGGPGTPKTRGSWSGPSDATSNDRTNRQKSPQ